jgi:hypothetical protein
MTDRHVLHSLVDQIVDEDMDDARQLLKEFLESREKYVSNKQMTPEEFQAYLDDAPEEDEEITEEEIRGIEEGRAAIRRGEYQSLESVMEELGIEN